MKTPMRNESNDEKRIRASPDVLADALFTDFEHRVKLARSGGASFLDRFE